jgi:methionyl-tRNA synthetase
VGCEVYLNESELDGTGNCPAHHAPPEWIEEDNWFFRLSDHADHLHHLISSGRLRITPEPFAREVLTFIEAGLQDISVSRSAARASGWGIPVPGDPGQVIYVWFDALTNYLSALDWGLPSSATSPATWAEQEKRIHVVGKGILRFHVIYWPAFLAAAGEPPPTEVRVHPYLTVDGAKISKSGRSGLDPVEAVDTVTADGLRWFFARDVNDVADTDVTLERIIDRVNDELANGLGNAVNRLATLAHRHLPDGIDQVDCRGNIDAACAAATHALASFEHRPGSGYLAGTISELNAEINATRPWELTTNPDDRPALKNLLATLIADARRIAGALEPICPAFANRILNQLEGPKITPPQPTFGRVG